jgi:hypothetical protein
VVLCRFGSASDLDELLAHGIQICILVGQDVRESADLG